MSTYRYTVHAAHRFRERFPCHDMRSELSRSIPFGGQFGDGVLRLSPCGAVFAIRGDMVLTTLTKEMAMANMQATLSQRRSLSLAAKLPQCKPVVKHPDVPADVAAAVRAMAHDHARMDDRAGRGLKGRKKQRNNEVRENFGDEQDNKFVWELYQRLYREFREALWAETRRRAAHQ